MTSIKLLSKEDNETGLLGLIVDGMKVTNYPSVSTEGRLIAHDILEHQNGIKSIGSIGDELEALGGVWYVRGKNGYLSLNSNYSPEENIASDVSNMAIMVFNNVPIRANKVETKKHYEDDSFKEIIKLSKEMYKKEIKCQLEENQEYDSLEEYFEQCLHLMRTGYRKAEKRFKNKCAISMFGYIEEAVDDIINEVEYEGQEFILTYNSSYASCKEIYYRY